MFFYQIMEALGGKDGREVASSSTLCTSRGLVTRLRDGEWELRDKV